VVVWKKFPGRASGTVILADGSPLPLGEIGPPALPMLFSRARFFEPAVFGGLDSWHAWTAPGRKFQAMVAFFLDYSSADLRPRACSGKSRGRHPDLIDGMQENAFWVAVFKELLLTRPLADAGVKPGDQAIRCTLGGLASIHSIEGSSLGDQPCPSPVAGP